jgi:hypothetical protein
MQVDLSADGRSMLQETGKRIMKQFHLEAVIMFFAALPLQIFAQPETPDTGVNERITRRLDNLEQRIVQLQNRTRSETAGVGAFVAAALCALWAQQTGRNPWLWFFLGLFFNVITLLVLLYKNARDKPMRSLPLG